MLLNSHTYYSFRYGAMSPDDLLQSAVSQGHDRIAVTDINSTSASLQVLRLASKYNIHVVVGVDFRRGVEQQFIALAVTNTGFQKINELLTAVLHGHIEMPSEAPHWDDSEVVVIYPIKSAPKRVLRSNEYIGVAPHEMFRSTWRKSDWEESRFVALATATFRHKRDFNAHRLLRAVDQNTLLSKLASKQVAEASDIISDVTFLKDAYASRPAWLIRSSNILERCNVYFGFGEEQQSQNQTSYTGSLEKDYALLVKLCKDGLEYRYPKAGKDVEERLTKELDIIREKGFVSYFLINWDIVHHARRKGYFYVGRGSGANSVVAYLLRITDVDPMELDLYFERFINLYRVNPPDFDIDFSWKDRDDMTDYIFKRFPNTSLLATYNTFQFKAVVRELGKVFGLPKHEIDHLSQGHFSRGRTDDQVVQAVLKYSQYIQGFPSHLSIHAGGILITEKPVQAYSATFMPPKGFPTTQFDMVVAEDVGIYKFDILSQRGLSKIQDTLAVIRKNQPKRASEVDIHDIPRFKEDESVKNLLRNGKAIGCFYVESPAMRMLLKKLKVDNYLALVAASSIIRPGVAKSGMMREYILRYRYPERRKDANPILLQIMPETFGVMVYQEDVIRVAHHYAGLSLGEADVLRRGMSGKYRSREEFQKVKEQFFINCKSKGYPESESAEVWRQIESFAGYAFAKGHSASYAVESYQSLFLKAHFPLEYMVSVINNFGGFYRTEFYVHEARMTGAEVCPPCINDGDYHTTIKGKRIYLGFMHLHSLEDKTALRILKERDRAGAFLDFDDFIDRVPIGVEQVSILIRINAFRFTGKSKRALLWEAHFKLEKKPPVEETPSMFRPESKNYTLPPLHQSKLEEVYDQIELLGFPLSNPFNLLKQDPDTLTLASDLPSNDGRNVRIYGYLVTRKDTKTVNGKRMHFGTFLDRTGHVFDTVHFPPVVAKYPFRGRGVYILEGKVVEEFGFYSLEVESCVKAELVPDPRFSEEDEWENKLEKRAV
ncbi:MAG: DNA polymerase III subunit alpha [Flavobacteriia bacterium]|nr:DNA polymerase III subunit alpha [Flavobacteriia bacterium]